MEEGKSLLVFYDFDFGMCIEVLFGKLFLFQKLFNRIIILLVKIDVIFVFFYGKIVGDSKKGGIKR